MNKQEYMSQETIQKTIQELYQNKQKISFLVKIIDKKELETSRILQFQFTSNNYTYTFEIENYLILDTWKMSDN
jgi:hypothetical protein